MALITPELLAEIKAAFLQWFQGLLSGGSRNSAEMLRLIESLIRYRLIRTLGPATPKEPVLGGVGVAFAAVKVAAGDALREYCGFLFGPVTVENYLGWGNPHTPGNAPLGTPGGTDPYVFLSFDHLDIADPYIDRSPGLEERGNVDWVDENNQVYTWGGPRSRYFIYPGRIDNTTPYDEVPRDDSRFIYYLGEILDVADFGIIGLAVRTNGNNTEIVYIRGNKEDDYNQYGLYIEVRGKSYVTADGPSSASWELIDTYDTRLGSYPAWVFNFFRYPNAIGPFNQAGTESTLVLREGSYITISVPIGSWPPIVSFDETAREYVDVEPTYYTSKRRCLLGTLTETGDCSPVFPGPTYPNSPIVQTLRGRDTTVLVVNPGNEPVDLTSYMTIGGVGGTPEEIGTLVEATWAESEKGFGYLPLCADYVDNEVVFAYWYNLPTNVDNQWQTIDSSSVNTTTTICDPFQVDSETTRTYYRDGTRFRIRGTLVKVPWLSRSIPLDGSNGESANKTNGSSTTPGPVANTVAILDSESFDINGEGNIRYLDLRNQIAVVGQTDVQVDVVTRTITRFYGSAGVDIFDRDRNAYSKRIVIYHKDNVIYSGTPKTTTPTHTENPTSQITLAELSNWGNTGGVKDVCDNNGTGPSPYTISMHNDCKDYIHWHYPDDAALVDEIQKVMSQWYGATCQGDVLISQQTFEAHPNPSEEWVKADYSFLYLYRAARPGYPEATYDFIQTLQLPPDETWHQSAFIKVLNYTPEEE